MSNEPISVKLDKLKGQQLIYNDVVVEVLDYCLSVSERDEGVEIYLSDGSTIYSDIFNIHAVIKKFHPIAKQAVVLQKEANKRNIALHSEIVSEVRDALLNQLRDIRKNPSKEIYDQSRALNDTVGQLTNLARTELEYKKLFVKMNGHTQKNK